MTSFNHSVTVLLGDKILRLVEQNNGQKEASSGAYQSSNNKQKQKQKTKGIKAKTTNKGKNNKQMQKQG